MWCRGMRPLGCGCPVGSGPIISSAGSEDELLF